eukprot:m.76347 g.76347  ORF g.76347 m.76347 type:complete len:475 (-) comp12552_c0_seq1:142-1566(-)
MSTSPAQGQQEAETSPPALQKKEAQAQARLQVPQAQAPSDKSEGAKMDKKLQNEEPPLLTKKALSEHERKLENKLEVDEETRMKQQRLIDRITQQAKLAGKVNKGSVYSHRKLPHTNKRKAEELHQSRSKQSRVTSSETRSSALEPLHPDVMQPPYAPYGYPMMMPSPYPMAGPHGPPGGPPGAMIYYAAPPQANRNSPMQQPTTAAPPQPMYMPQHQMYPQPHYTHEGPDGRPVYYMPVPYPSHGYPYQGRVAGMPEATTQSIPSRWVTESKDRQPYAPHQSLYEKDAPRTVANVNVHEIERSPVAYVSIVDKSQRNGSAISNVIQQTKTLRREKALGNSDSKGRKRKSEPRTPQDGICACCQTRNTPMWREGHNSTRLCNACGLRWAKYGVACRNCNYIPGKSEVSNPLCTKCGKELPPPEVLVARRNVGGKVAGSVLSRPALASTSLAIKHSDRVMPKSVDEGAPPLQVKK